jgi:hypothetical protein
MTKFGRYEFGKMEAAETYEGDFMMMDERGIVRIFVGTQGTFPTIGFSSDMPELVAAIHLDTGQSVRKIAEPEAGLTKGTPKRKAS